MAFTFEPTSTDAETKAISIARLKVGDHIENDGALPSGGNVQDEHLSPLYDDEGSDAGRLLAAYCEHLAAVWSREAKRRRLGPQSATYGTAEYYTEQAAMYRERYGYAQAQNRIAMGAATARPARVND